MSDVTGPASTASIGIGVTGGGVLLKNAWGFSPHVGNLAPLGAQIAARVLVPVGLVLAFDGMLELATGTSLIRELTTRSFNEHVQHALGLEQPAPTGVSLRGR